jgi:hypothetical protein
MFSLFKYVFQSIQSVCEPSTLLQEDCITAQLTDKSPEETKAVPSEDSTLTVETANVLKNFGLLTETDTYDAVIERWNKLDQVLREHKVPRSDLFSAINLLHLYRGSESKAERAAKMRSWSEELERTDRREGLYNLGVAEVRKLKPHLQFLEWEVVRLKDILARNLKERSTPDCSSLKAGVEAGLPVELMEANPKLKAYQANQLLKEFSHIELSDPLLQVLDFAALRTHLEGRSLKKRAARLEKQPVKVSKLTQDQTTSDRLPNMRFSTCRQLSLQCLAKWVARDLPCRFCRRLINDPCVQCSEFFAASHCIVYYECSHFMHKWCVSTLANKDRCPQCQHTSTAVQLN